MTDDLHDHTDDPSIDRLRERLLEPDAPEYDPTQDAIAKAKVAGTCASKHVSYLVELRSIGVPVYAYLDPEYVDGLLAATKAVGEVTSAGNDGEDIACHLATMAAVAPHFGIDVEPADLREVTG